MLGILIFFLLVVIALGSIGTTAFVVKQQYVYIIERFGHYHTLKKPGLHVKAPFGIDVIAAQVPLRIQQKDMTIETKTKDNVFVIMKLAVQFVINASSEQSITDSYYKLANPLSQIQSYVENAIRASLPKYTLDEAYDNQEGISQDVFQTVSAEMSSYGYSIIKTLITSIEPDAEVKQSMNEINAAQRKQEAAKALAEAEKIKVVTAAQAEAEKDQLHGKGIANERKEIINGLKEQFDTLEASGLTQDEVMSILLTEQYLDTMNNFAKSGGSNTIFLPNSTMGSEDIRSQIMSALAASSKDTTGK